MPTLTIEGLYLEIGIPALVAGLLLGALVMWFVAHSRERRLQQSLDLLETQIKDQEALQRERDSALEMAKAQLTSAFSELANQSLRSNSDNFLRLAEQNLGTQQEKAKRELSEREQAVENLVKPIREALQQSQRQISELEKARSEAYGNIRSQLEQMQSSQKFLAQETQNLVNALRRPQVRGRWGEITLRRLVELAGMVEHCDFQEQVQSTGDDRTIRPDMIVSLPDQRQLVVDVKTPLDAYLEAVEARDDAQHKACLERHARNVRDHIRKLASKAYWDQFSSSPEFVILFIPGDQFLSAALNEDPELIESALSQRIILATPTSFVALLKAVAFGWRQVALAENAEEIRKLAQDLYTRLSVFVSHLNRVGKQLGSSVDHYNKAIGSLERMVLPGARKFVELGVRPRKEMETLDALESMPRSMIEGDQDENEPLADEAVLESLTQSLPDDAPDDDSVEDMPDGTSQSVAESEPDEDRRGANEADEEPPPRVSERP